MKLSGKISRILAAAAIVGILAAPALASTTIPGSLLAGNGYGDADGSSSGEYGPGDCGDDMGSIEITMDNTMLLAKGGGGNGKGGDNGGNGSGDQDRDQTKDQDCQTS